MLSKSIVFSVESDLSKKGSAKYSSTLKLQLQITCVLLYVTIFDEISSIFFVIFMIVASRLFDIKEVEVFFLEFFRNGFDIFQGERFVMS